MNSHAASWLSLAFSAQPCGYMPANGDTFVVNNAGTKKETAGRAYQGVDGYTPSAAYLGSLRYCLELALRPNVQHSALETELNLGRVLPMATRLTKLGANDTTDTVSERLKSRLTPLRHATG